jgi:hypothetical protein
MKKDRREGLGHQDEEAGVLKNMHRVARCPAADVRAKGAMARPAGRAYFAYNTQTLMCGSRLNTASVHASHKAREWDE